MEPLKLRTHAPATTSQSYVPDDLVDDDSYYSTRLPTSAVRYTTTQGQQVIQRGNKRFVIHDEPPPRRRRKVHWMLILGIGMIFMLLLWVSLSWVTTWWTNHQLDATYGMPRTYQVDEVVGYTDSSDHPSHFIFLNLSGHVLIIELPGGDSAHARIYSGPQIFADNLASVPVTGEFKDVNGDGKIDMIVTFKTSVLSTSTPEPISSRNRRDYVPSGRRTSRRYVLRYVSRLSLCL